MPGSPGVDGDMGIKEFRNPVLSQDCVSLNRIFLLQILFIKPEMTITPLKGLALTIQERIKAN